MDRGSPVEKSKEPRTGFVSLSTGRSTALTSRATLFDLLSSELWKKSWRP